MGELFIDVAYVHWSFPDGFLVHKKFTKICVTKDIFYQNK